MIEVYCEERSVLVCVGCILFDKIIIMSCCYIIRDAASFRVFISEKWFKMLKRRLCVDSNSEKSDPKISFGQPSHASGRPSVSRRFE
jgi:hypothetical protein